MKTILKPVILILLFALISLLGAQATSIVLDAQHWEFEPESVEFVQDGGVTAMKLLNNQATAVLKDFNFKDGTIEFDIQLNSSMFNPFYFRWKDTKEAECFYFRNAVAGNKQAIQGIQYAPIVDGVNLWDVLFHYQTGASFQKGEWNHVKLVISGNQMRAYVNDLSRPALQVPMLEGTTSTGTLAFGGPAAVKNLEVISGEVEGLQSTPGLDPTDVDTRYLRKWRVSEPVSMMQNIDLDYNDMPNESTVWEPIVAERRGLINLTRKFGQTKGKRLVWLKTTIRADEKTSKTMRLGFSDEVWLIINGQPLYLDKNLYGTPMAKFPDGRCSIENTSFQIPLKKGDNELVVGVSNFFYGWGIVARLDDLEKVTIED